jgi:hypothetical protein
MASTKRVTGNYDIYANLVTVHGNLTVIGSQTTLDTINSQVKDNIIILNEGESGAGVTAGSAGLQVDRGSLPNAQWTFTETNTFWSGKINGSYVNIRAATPVVNDDVVTKGYLFSVGSVAGGSDRNIQYNNNSVMGGDEQFSYYANGNVVLGTTTISNTSIIQTSASNDLILDAGGTTYIKDVVKLQFQTGSTPTNVASTVQLLANTPGQGGSGLYVVNSNYSDELISKRKATWLGLVFS